jgi:glycosyltransferase involved in cell wall biosynthesis
VIYDDGSSDGTYEYVKANFPQVVLLRNETSKGYLFCRNRMLNECKSLYAVSLDDDAHFLSHDPLELIEKHFNSNRQCGVIAFRIYWALAEPIEIPVDDTPERVKGFVGCGHAWRMDSWRQIPDYPEWFQFYGEENAASISLFKKNINVDYLPSVFVLHRVDLKARRHNKAFGDRYKNALKADYYLYFLFFPMKVIPKKLAYSLYIQFKNKIFKDQPRLVFPLMSALFAVLAHIPTIIRERNALSYNQYKEFTKLKDTKIYWNP